MYDLKASSRLSFLTWREVERGITYYYIIRRIRLCICNSLFSLGRYDAETNELINEELGIAYPIVGGIPNMIPQEARLIQKDGDASTTPTQG